MMIAQTTLFDRPAEATLGGASTWVQQLLGGTLAVSLCLIAVAFLGCRILTGRLPLRRGFMVVLGCFLLLGGPLVADEMLGRFREAGAGNPEPLVVEPPPPADYDPYAVASLRRVP